ncbi:MAG: tetratricopeptide repeat protein [Candidatus Nitrosotenuis sp.]
MSAEEIFEKGITEFNLGNYKKALLFFEKVLGADPSHVMALIKKGNILGKFGRYLDAILCYDAALRAEPKNSLALVNKGLALHYLQRYDDAILCYDAVLRLKPQNPTTLYNKASSLILQNKTAEGFAILEEVIKIDLSYKYKARFDVDFDGIKKTSEFMRIVL